MPAIVAQDLQTDRRIRARGLVGGGRSRLFARQEIESRQLDAFVRVVDQPETTIPQYSTYLFKFLIYIDIAQSGDP